jgi:hypothetical protein
MPPSPPTLKFHVESNPKQKTSNVRALINDELAHVDAFNLNNSRARKRFAEQLVTRNPRLSLEAVEHELLKMTGPTELTPKESDSRTREELLAENDEKVEELLAATPAKVLSQAEAMLMSPRLVDDILTDLAFIGVVGEQPLSLSLYLIAVSRLLAHPLSSITQGTTSSGKSFTQSTIADFMPPEAVLRATDISPWRCIYMTPGTLIHTYVAAGERSRIESDEQADAKRALREMISEEGLASHSP